MQNALLNLTQHGFQAGVLIEQQNLTLEELQ